MGQLNIYLYMVCSVMPNKVVIQKISLKFQLRWYISRNNYEQGLLFRKFYSLKIPVFANVNATTRNTPHYPVLRSNIIILMHSMLWQCHTHTHTHLDITDTTEIKANTSAMLQQLHLSFLCNSNSLTVSTNEQYRILWILRVIRIGSGPLLPKKTLSYWYRDSHYKPGAVIRLS